MGGWIHLEEALERLLAIPERLGYEVEYRRAERPERYDVRSIPTA